MQKPVVYLFVFNGFADWEPSYAIAGLQKYGQYKVQTVAVSKELVQSMGGLSIVPDKIISEISPTESTLLILPGGDTWETGENREAIGLMRKFVEAGKPVAAICGATVALANNRLLENIRHTSNSLDYLKQVAPAYSGENHYVSQLCISDQNIITASGIAPLEFAREIFRKLGVLDEENLENWYHLFKYGQWTGAVQEAGK